MIAQIIQQNMDEPYNPYFLHDRRRYWDFLTIRNVKLLLHDIFNKPIYPLNDNNLILIENIEYWLIMHANGQKYYFYDYVRRNLNSLLFSTTIRQIVCNHPHFKQYVIGVRSKPITHRNGRTFPVFATRYQNSTRECKKRKPMCNPLVLQMFVTIENVRDFYNYMLERDIEYFPKCGKMLSKFLLSLEGQWESLFSRHSLYELLHNYLCEQVAGMNCVCLHIALCEYVGYQRFIRDSPPIVFRLVAMMEQIQKQSCAIRESVVILFADEYVMKYIVAKI